MLRTNSKKAKENLRNYVMECDAADFEDNNGRLPADFTELAGWIKNRVYEEMIKHDNRKLSTFDYFENFMAGLGLVSSKYFYISAVEILGNILEETEEERNRFTETDAENMMTKLLFREIYC